MKSPTPADMRELSTIAWGLSLPLAAYGIVTRGGWTQLPLDVRFVLLLMVAFGIVLRAAAWMIERKGDLHS